MNVKAPTPCRLGMRGTGIWWCCRLYTVGKWIGIDIMIYWYHVVVGTVHRTATLAGPHCHCGPVKIWSKLHFCVRFLCVGVCDGMYAGDSLDWAIWVCESLLHMRKDKPGMCGGWWCCRVLFGDKLSVYVEGSVWRMDWGRPRVFNDGFAAVTFANGLQHN